MIEINKTYQGNSLHILKTFPDNYFHSCINSPPYYGLRSYKTEHQVWDEVPELECSHDWGKEIIAKNTGGGWNDAEKRENYENQRLKNPKKERPGKVSQGMFCKKCSAWRGELGLEPTPKLYLKHLKDIFREVYRVLKTDGTLFVNIGDAHKDKGQLQLPERFSIMLTDELKFIRDGE